MIPFHDHSRNAIQDHAISIDHVSTEEMPADIFTKALPKVKHNKCIELLGMKIPQEKSTKHYKWNNANSLMKRNSMIMMRVLEYWLSRVG
jgi:hypothetical protein